MNRAVEALIDEAEDEYATYGTLSVDTHTALVNEGLEADVLMAQFEGAKQDGES